MLNKSGQVYGWPNGGYPFPQGPFYCGVGSESVYGRPLAEAHMDACIKVSPLPFLMASQIHCMSDVSRDLHTQHPVTFTQKSGVLQDRGLGFGKRCMCPGVSRRGDLLVVFRVVNAPSAADARGLLFGRSDAWCCGRRRA